jgi:hypothetical protein
MKMLNDYCNHCNSQRIVVEIDDADNFFNMKVCEDCLEHALNLLKEDDE